MKVVTITNTKGGTMKSTLSINLAAGLAAEGSRVMLIDTDPQAHATIGLGLGEEPALHDFICRDAPLKDVVRPIPKAQLGMREDAPGDLVVIPSNVETRVIPLNTTNVFALQQRLQELEGYVDIVVIDTAPTPSLFQAMIYIATDYLLYPTKCEYFSFDGLRKSLGFREQFQPFRLTQGLDAIEVMGVIPVMVRPKTIEHIENLAKLRSAFGNEVWDVIQQRTIWAESARERRPVFAFAPNSEAAKDAWRVVHRVQAGLEAVR